MQLRWLQFALEKTVSHTCTEAFANSQFLPYRGKQNERCHHSVPILRHDEGLKIIRTTSYHLHSQLPWTVLHISPH